MRLLRRSDRLFPRAAMAAAATVALAACGGTSSSSTSGASSASSSSAAPSGASACTPQTLKTHTPGTLTVATDSPAYPPYFVDNKPQNGKGFESAVAYAVAAKLGYARSQVKWVVEPFDSSYAPGPKAFDFDINEISITPQRAQQVDFSAPYYTNPQGVIVSARSSLAHTRSLAALRAAPIGVQIGTTSLAAVTAEIKPSNQPQVFNTSNDVVSAFKIHRVQVIVTDLATAFTMTATQLSHTVIAGQFSAPGGDNWGLLLSKGSPLTGCVNSAVRGLRANGTLAALDKRWISSAASVPELR